MDLIAPDLNPDKPWKAEPTFEIPDYVVEKATFRYRAVASEVLNTMEVVKTMRYNAPGGLYKIIDTQYAEAIGDYVEQLMPFITAFRANNLKQRHQWWILTSSEPYKK